MKTTIDFPDAIFRQAKAIAAARGMTLKRLFSEALEERLRGCAAETRSKGVEPPWMAGFGALCDIAEENRHVLQLIEEEFERISPEDLHHNHLYGVTCSRMATSPGFQVWAMM